MIRRIAAYSLAFALLALCTDRCLAQPAGCLYSLDHENVTFTASGGTSNVSVLASGNFCAWSALSNAVWITIDSSANGAGVGLVSFTVAPNASYFGRVGSISVAGKSLSITQSGVPCSFRLTPRTITVPSIGVAGNTVKVTATAPDCAWKVYPGAPWILVGSGNSGMGNDNIAYSVGVNTSSLRTAAVGVSQDVSLPGTAFYVNQLGPQDSSSLLATISDGGIVNTASNTPPVVSSSFVTIYGQNFADGIATWDSVITAGVLPNALNGVQVRI